MPAHRHALVIGKFYPPHRGHHWLIRETVDIADRTTVVVMSSVYESIPVADRVAWLRQEHAADASVSFVGVRCDAPVDIDDEHVWTAQVAIMRAGARSLTDVPVDVVVTSEAYGPELAERFGAAHVVMPRTSDGLSASLVRHGLADRWTDLAPAIRSGLALRIAVVGADPAATTSVCRRLAEHYRNRGGIWAETAVVVESSSQAAASLGSPLLICDDGRGLPTHSEPAALAPRDLYLVTDHVDGMTELLEDTLVAAGQSWVLLTGSLEDRVALAIRSIDPLLERRLAFTAPKTGPGFEATVVER